MSSSIANIRKPLALNTDNFDLCDNSQAVLTLLAEPKGKKVRFLYPIENPILQRKIEKEEEEQKEPISEAKQKQQAKRSLPDIEKLTVKKKKLL
jgi:hypothetical protein